MKRLLLAVALLIPLPAYSQEQADQKQIKQPSEQELQKTTQTKVIDKKFIAIMSAEAAAKSADFYSTSQFLAHCSFCYEADPIFGHHPTDERIIFTNIGIFSAETFLTSDLLTCPSVS